MTTQPDPFAPQSSESVAGAQKYVASGRAARVRVGPEADRSLVEAWLGRLIGEDVATEHRGTAEMWERDGHDVVPLIAADRLTDEALVEAIDTIWVHKPRPHTSYIVSDETTRAVLAALRAHLESA